MLVHPLEPVEFAAASLALLPEVVGLVADGLEAAIDPVEPDEASAWADWAAFRPDPTDKPTGVEVLSAALEYQLREKSCGMFLTVQPAFWIKGYEVIKAEMDRL